LQHFSSVRFVSNEIPQQADAKTDQDSRFKHADATHPMHDHPYKFPTSLECSCLTCPHYIIDKATRINHHDANKHLAASPVGSASISCSFLLDQNAIDGILHAPSGQHITPPHGPCER
jgi:hypothetical protein